MGEKVDLREWYERELLPLLTPELVFQGVRWTSQRGADWRAACPLHGGDNATAFKVNPETLRWHCFTGCGGGDALDFLAGGRVQDQPGGFVEALKRAAALVGLELPERELSPEARERFEKSRRRRGLLEDFLAVCKEALAGEAGAKAREHLLGRGFQGKDLEALDVGWCPPGAELRASLEGRGHKAEELGEAKLESLAGRLVLGLRGDRGELVSAGGRALGSEAPKYRYLPGQKPPLPGLGEALPAARDAREGLVLVESLLDAFLLRARGLENVAALGGTSLSVETLERLSALGVKRATLALDGEPGGAGEKATAAALVNASKARNAPIVSVVTPRALWRAGGAPEEDGGPAKVDPGDVVRAHGLEAFQALLAERELGTLYRGRLVLGDVTPETPEADRRAVAEDALDFAAGLSALDREPFLLETSERTGFSPETLAELATARAKVRREEERDLRLRDLGAELARAKRPRMVAEDVRQALAEVSAGEQGPPPVFSVARLVRETRRLPEGLASGWEPLDSAGVRFNPGELSLLAARPGHAKTSASVSLLHNWLHAEDVEGRLLLYSLEEPEPALFWRLMAAEVALEGERDGLLLSTPNVREHLQDEERSRGDYPNEAELLDAALQTAEAWEDRLQVVFCPRWTVEEIADHARAVSAGGKVAAVLVDYLQKIPPSGKADRRDIEVSHVGRGLKALAVELACPVVSGAQINRETAPDRNALAEARTWQDAKDAIRKCRPGLLNLREGGSEQEADLVLGLLNYRADLPRGEETGFRLPDPATLLEVGVLKARYGEVGAWLSLAFVGKAQRVRSPEPGEAPEL